MSSRYLGILPPLMFLAGAVLANHVTATIAGLPFFFVWTITSVAVSSAVMAVIYHLDQPRKGRPR